MLFLLALDGIEDLTEREILTRIYNENSVFVGKIILSRYKSLESDIDDIISEVFIKMIIYRSKFLDADNELIRQLLLLFTRSVCIDWIKKKNNRWSINRKLDNDNDYTLADFQNTDIVFDEIWRKENITIVKDILSKLQPIERDIVFYKHVYGFTYKEIAELLNITVTNVGTILNRTLKKIKKEMREKLNDE